MIGKEEQEAQGRDGQEKKAVNNVLPAPPASPRVGTAWEDVVGGTVLLLHLWPGVPCDELARSHIDFVEDAPVLVGKRFNIDGFARKPSKPAAWIDSVYCYDRRHCHTRGIAETLILSETRQDLYHPPPAGECRADRSILVMVSCISRSAIRAFHSVCFTPMNARRRQQGICEVSRRSIH